MKNKSNKSIVSSVNAAEGLPEGSGVGRPDMETILRNHNTSVEKIVGKLLPSLDATHDIKDRDGDVIETVPDWNVRIKGGTLLMTALGYMKGSEVSVTVNTEAKKEAEDAYKRWRTADISALQ